MEEIEITSMERLEGDRGWYCKGRVGRLSFTAGLQSLVEDCPGWQIGLMGGGTVASDSFKGKQLQERRELAHKIKGYLNREHTKGGNMADATLKDLQDAAKDINTVFGLDDPIDIEQEDEDKLAEEIRIRTMNPDGEKDAGLIRKDLDGEDHLKKDTIKTLVAVEAMPEDLIPVAKAVAGIKDKKLEDKKTMDKGGKGTVTKKKTTAKKPVTKKTALKKKTTAKKATTKKPAAKKSDEKPKQSIGSFVTEGLKSGKFKGKTDEEIAKLTRDKFGSKTSVSSIKWYRNQLK